MRFLIDMVIGFVFGALGGLAVSHVQAAYRRLRWDAIESLVDGRIKEHTEADPHLYKDGSSY